MTPSPTQSASGSAPSAEISLTPRRQRAKGPGRWTHPFIYAGARAMCAAAGIMGIERSIRLARSVSGWYAGLSMNERRLERAKVNLRWCFPDLDEDRVHARAIEAYRHLFTIGVEVMASPQLIASDAYVSYVQVGSVEAGLKELLRDRPCLLVTGHCGNWELLGATMAMLGFPMHALYRPMDIKPLNDWLYRTRAARGIKLVDKFGAAQRLPELLKQGESVAFIADQNAGDRGLFVPFFNRLASAYKTIGVMAMRYRAPIVCGTAKRLSGGAEASDERRRRIIVSATRSTSATSSSPRIGTTSPIRSFTSRPDTVGRSSSWFAKRPNSICGCTATGRAALATSGPVPRSPTASAKRSVRFRG
ncbi:MAG: lysophospholipid acyltransferase family protein [Phycisphaerales bacterium]